MAVTKGIPEVMWFGTTEGEWPIQTWASEAHALAWLNEKREEGVYVARKRRVWRASVSLAVEYEVFAPEPTLRIKDQ